MVRIMKICFISLKSYPIFNKNINSIFGGAEVQLYLLSKEFSKYKGVDVNVIVADYGQKDIEIYKDIKLYKSNNFKKNHINQFLNFFKVFNKIKAEVYIQRTLTPVSGLIALYCKIINKYFIYMVAHDSEVDGNYRKKHGFFKNWIAKLTFNFADMIIVQNNTQKNYLTYRGRPSNILKSSSTFTNNSKYNQKYILWVGRSEKWKNPEMFIKLAEMNPKNKFIMICSTAIKQEKYHLKIKNQASKIMNLQFIDFVPYAKIDTYFRDAKHFINTSEQEGFPNTFIQAAKNKTPIISLNVNPDDMLNKYNCGFYCKNKFSNMNIYLNELLLNQKLYNKMSLNAYKYAKEKHNIKKNAKQFYNLIKEGLYVKK